MPTETNPYPVPVGGNDPTGGGPVDPQFARTRQAAWRLSARSKNNTAAWIMWALAPFVVGIQIHDFYLGAIGRGLLKIALAVVGWGSFMAGYMLWIFSFTTTVSNSASSNPTTDEIMPGPLFWVGLGIMVLCLLTLLFWWIYDAFVMTKRIEEQNDKIRQEIASEQGIDPWSF